MNPSVSASSNAPAIPNGFGAAAILAAGIGCFALAVLSIGGDKSAFLKSHLSGVTTVAILVWLFTWGILNWRWRSRTVAISRISAAALALLVLGILLTFPPIADFF